MGRKVILLLIIALMAFAPAYALRNLTYSETEKVALSPIVADPDNDAIEIEYSPPLDANGEWQTDYGDAGQYNITLTVSDGENRVAEELLLVISRKEEPPVIISSAPAEEEIEVDEGGSVKASIGAQDPNKDRLRYSWLLDGDDVAEAMEFTYKPGYSDAGDHVLVVVISDQASEIRREWKIKVNNADFEGIIGAISDIIVDEGETARIDIPDLGKHGLKYEISEPIGQDNYWKTGYDDAGMYNVNLRFYKEGIELAKNIAVSVHNVDRPPKFAPIDAKSVPEGSELSMELKAEDPDGDVIIFSSDSLPEGARIEGNAFIWTPGFD
ncbi:hypothetical protein HYX09_03875, partial [Candidatus Woesearchaeota archaeon]|nr:hypothetical protein [Candidatus Woesearchaeota archaeon]